MTNYYKLIKEKIFDLLSAEFIGHEVKIFKHDNPELYGSVNDSISIDIQDKRFLKRWAGLYIDEYPVALILRRRIIDTEKAQDDLGEYAERIIEKLVEKNRNIQSSDSLWFDSIIEYVETPDKGTKDETFEESEIDHIITLNWFGYVSYTPHQKFDSLWEYDNNEDLQPVQYGQDEGIWEQDSNDDLEPVNSTAGSDKYWKFDGSGDIIPKL